MVLVFVENSDGKFKKAALEAVTYGRKTADLLGSECHALVIGAADNAGELGNYGATKVYQLSNDNLNSFDSQTYTQAISGVANDKGASTIILSNNASGMALTGRLAARLDAACVSGANALPTLDGSNLRIKKNIFSGKAISEMTLTGEKKVISVTGNSLKPETIGSPCEVEAVSVDVSAPKSKVISQDKQTGGPAPLPEAELVVSAGRGMKGPENWGIIEDLANIIGATTACSRPVADTGWRPHHEHVGQTGVAIRPNLYIAAGISGAIQHLAGVNQSKCIVVINKDPEAPFFKAADYGVCADLFDVVPKLTEAIKKAKA